MVVNLKLAFWEILFCKIFKIVRSNFLKKYKKMICLVNIILNLKKEKERSNSIFKTYFENQNQQIYKKICDIHPT
jgi:hypothetical protein